MRLDTAFNIGSRVVGVIVSLNPRRYATASVYLERVSSIRISRHGPKGAGLFYETEEGGTYHADLTFPGIIEARAFCDRKNAALLQPA